MQTYSFKKSLIKNLIRLALFGIPILMTLLPHEWMNMTLGTVLAMIFDVLKAKTTLA